jgi:hypothetical protein
MGRCAGLRYGRVIAVQWSKTPTWSSAAPVPKLRVQGVDDDWDHQKPRLCKPGTLEFPRRVLRIAEGYIPTKVLNMLLDSTAEAVKAFYTEP